MPDCQGAQVVHQRRDVVAGFEENEATLTTEGLRRFVDPVREFAIRQLRIVGDDRDAFVVAAQVLDE